MVIVFLPITTFKLKFCVCEVTVFMSMTSFGRVSCSLKPVIIFSSSKDKKSRQTHQNLCCRLWRRWRLESWKLTFCGSCASQPLWNFWKACCFQQKWFPWIWYKSKRFCCCGSWLSFVSMLTKFALCLTLYVVLLLPGSCSSSNVCVVDTVSAKAKPALETK